MAASVCGRGATLDGGDVDRLRLECDIEEDAPRADAAAEAVTLASQLPTVTRGRVEFHRPKKIKDTFPVSGGELLEGTLAGGSTTTAQVMADFVERLGLAGRSLAPRPPDEPPFCGGRRSV